MATELTRDDLRNLARLGASRRLEELQQEINAIRAAFPDLAGNSTGQGRGGKRRGRPPGSGATGRGSAAAKKAWDTRRANSAANDGAEKVVAKAGKRRRRRKMSPAEKRAVSERMRKYWADRRKGKG
ncbi:MAG TPA: hypothetical protein VNJ02_08000 [Vicinamibacterales bacterium]|nr:hypothetical protein [Vicinamibacterales bacterium]